MPRQNLLFFRSKGREADLDEKEIIRLCLEGNREAFEQIVSKYRNFVFWTAYDLVLNHEDARDVAQQTFLKVWRSLTEFELDKSFKNWIRKIAAHSAIDLLRSRKATEPLEDLQTEQFSQDRSLDLRKIFLRIAPLLSPRQRVVLVLREVYGMEMSEISDLLQCSESTVRNLLFQAKESFRKNVRHLFPEYGL